MEVEELQARHRKEAKELQGRITGKKKQATKKTRKGVNDECARLEEELKARHTAELAALNGESAPPEDIPEESEPAEDQTLAAATKDLSLSEPPTANEHAAPPDATHQRRPNRARARMERRRQEQEALMTSAASEAQALPDLGAMERESMVSALRARGLVEKEIRADGHCLFAAFADQMDVVAKTDLGGPKEERYRVARKEAGQYMTAHGEDFEPFLDGETLAEHVRKVQDTGEWGGQLELMALARRYGVVINVLQGGGRVEEIGEGETKLWLAYYRHGFGLGEHYNSLRKV